ncbi:MAG: oxygenase, partial [Zetaproteobacteria bacterium]
DELTRSYSLASLPEEDALELHIKRVPGGQMSGWIFDELQEGDEVVFHGPAGDCFYLPGHEEQPLLLVGTGTGLAPLYGIVRDALRHGHRGPIYLYHGSLHATGLYLEETLSTLAERNAQFHYVPCVLQGTAPRGGRTGNIVDVPKRELGSLNGYRVYLCGDPELVHALRQQCFLAGAAMQDIYADPFVFTPAAE